MCESCDSLVPVFGFNCHGTDIRGTSDPEVFLTLNPVGSVSLLDQLAGTKPRVRNLVLNWITPTLGKDATDWVGLFKKDVSKEKNLKRKKFSLSAIPRLV
jgi:hypothetical protein